MAGYTHTKMQQDSLEIYFDQTLGIGSYGQVCKAKSGQLPCAAKVLHQTLFQFRSGSGTDDYATKFEKECEFLCAIKHPNIIQHLGTMKDPILGRPILLMEMMDESLTDHLKQSFDPLPYHRQVSISYDVALALSYLHSNGIIHSDLSSNNVLLMGGGNRAKVTDFGLYKLIDTNPCISPLTHSQGTLTYMAPEVLLIPPNYSTSMDSFSFGVLVLQSITKNFPQPGDAHKYVEDANHPTGRVVAQLPELKRREKDIILVKSDHPLLPTVLDCLRDRDTERPSADELCKKLASLKIETKYSESVEESRSECKFQEQLLAKEKIIKEFQAQMETKVEEHDKEVNELKEELAATKQLVEEYRLKLEKKATEINKFQEEMEAKSEKHKKEAELMKEELVTMKRLMEEYRLKLEKKAVERNETMQAESEKHDTSSIQQQDNCNASPPTEEAGPARELELTKVPEPAEVQHPVQEKKHERVAEEPQELAKEPETMTKIATKEPEVKGHESTAGTAKKEQRKKSWTRRERKTSKRSKQEPTKEALKESELVQTTQSAQKLTPLNSTPTFKWRQGKLAPDSVGSLHGTVVVHGNIAYFSRHFNIFSYQLLRDQWDELRPSQYQSFSLVVIDNQLTTIGGISRDQRRTKCLYSLAESRMGKKWKDQYPPMPTHRVFAATLTTPTHLLVAGGRNKTELNTVEVMNRESFQWCVATNLPEAMGHPQMTLCNGFVHVCYQQAFYSCSLESFLESCHTLEDDIPASNDSTSTSMWTRLADIPTYGGYSFSTLNEQALVIGGQDSQDRETASILGYDRVNDSWSSVGELPTPRVDVLTAVLPVRDLVVVGGWSNTDTYKITEIGKY